jgi:hypothetical protein
MPQTLGMSSVDNSQSAAKEFASSSNDTRNPNGAARNDEELSCLSTISFEPSYDGEIEANDDSSNLSGLLKHLDAEKRATNEGLAPNIIPSLVCIPLNTSFRAE